ncbi:short-chain dehydrogenase [Bacillus coahuilensis m2-6]|uniref:SDR family oxidoreductase n=1 Tax=Bacillus coahuilensis TaxID=408580 RepID=UPI000750236A|nr:SDR family oxidoreductase [Bacillus coahuilensis]KUP09722.1 short-chain dehydrogenase [Bacillus coahuilensis m2-6]
MKRIFITGTGSGLGRGAAIGLAKKGHHVIATTELTSQKTDLIREAEELGLEMDIFKLDITNQRDREEILKREFDIFVANAAINEGGPLAEVPMDRFRALFEVNVFATLETVQLAAKKLVQKKNGKIIFMSSMAGISATPYVGPYTATKHAIEGIAQTMRSELEELGVQVATINPGAFETGFNKRSAEEKWKWFDESKHFTPKDSMIEQEKGLQDQFDPEDMIEKMIEIIPAEHHKFRTVYPEETEKQLKETQSKRWELEI